MPPELIEQPTSDNSGWLPYGIRHDGTRLLVDWCKLADDRLEEPFFDQTIHRILQRNPRASRSTPVETLGNVTSKNAPAGFIFHLSRCGSTLITQMLASVRQFVVFSEPAILETLLRGTYQRGEVSNEQKTWLLRNVIQAFVACKADERGTFVKFTARAILDYPLIAQAYPDVPCIFVYREPVEVLVSLAGNQGDRLPPGLSEAGLLNDDQQAIQAMHPTEFWARVVANQCAAAVEMCNCSQPLLVNYSQLPQAVWTDIVNIFGVALSVDDVKQMQETLRRSAKDPRKHFTDDRAAKRAATDETRALVDHLLRPYYNRLESIRVATEICTDASST